MSQRVLLRGGYVLSMDDQVGELAAGDVLVEDALIAAVAESVEAGDAEVVDIAGHVVVAGFVDTHRHTWQTPCWQSFGVFKNQGDCVSFVATGGKNPQAGAKKR